MESFIYVWLDRKYNANVLPYPQKCRGSGLWVGGMAIYLSLVNQEVSARF